jgi:hypothetical protein
MFLSFPTGSPMNFRTAWSDTIPLRYAEACGDGH